MEETEQNPQQPEPQKSRSWINVSFSGVFSFLRHRFDLNEDKAEQDEVVDSICRSVEFRGTNLWVLMFAIVVASVGLNMNSTAVIIGAMLISPLMGPIMGVGVSLGISNFDLLKRSLRNFIFATIISLVVSMLYFMVSPLTLVQSEMLSRTTPTIWDVLIAIFGGLAGIVAQSRRDRTSTVIPGVAIATALMPPLCTAGYGLAMGEWRFFGGALYLFFINAVFIALSAFFIVRFMKYSRVEYVHKARAKRINRIMAIVIVVTVVPSVVMAYGMVRRSIFESNVNRFIRDSFRFESSWVLTSDYTYNVYDDSGSIEVAMGGDPISGDAIELVRNQLSLFSLDNAELLIRQGERTDAISSDAFATALERNARSLDQKNSQIQLLEAELSAFRRDTLPVRSISREIGAMWPIVESVVLSRGDIVSVEGDVIGVRVVCYLSLRSSEFLSDSERARLLRWLVERTGDKELHLIVR